MTNESEARTDGGALLQKRDSEPTQSSDRDAEAASEPSSDGPTPDSPTAAFAYAPSAPVVGNPALFEAETPTDARSREYEWEFGDEGTATGPKASHVFDSAGKTDVTLTVTEDGETATVRRTVTVYREVDVEVQASDDEGLVPVAVGGPADFDPETVAVESLRFGAPTALAMGSGAAPVRTEARDGDLRVWVRADETGLGDDDATARLAGRTTGGVPLAGTAEATVVGP